MIRNLESTVFDFSHHMKATGTILIDFSGKCHILWNNSASL